MSTFAKLFGLIAFGALNSLSLCSVYGQPASANADEFKLPVERLAKLTPDKPESYRDLAEELSVQQHRDASALTVRLYLIAAFHGKEKLRRSALRGLIHSARSDTERRSFILLAYLNDPKFADLDRELQSKSSTDVAADEKTKPDELIRQAVVLLRRGKSVRAEKLVQENNLADHFKKFQNILSYNEFSQLCKLSSLSNEALAKLIKLDLEIRNIEFEMDTRSDDQAWQKMFQKRLPDRIKQIDFETVCEFDPNKSVFQNNSWRRPN